MISLQSLKSPTIHRAAHKYLSTRTVRMYVQWHKMPTSAKSIAVNRRPTTLAVMSSVCLVQCSTWYARTRITLKTIAFVLRRIYRLLFAQSASTHNYGPILFSNTVFLVTLHYWNVFTQTLLFIHVYLYLCSPYNVVSLRWYWKHWIAGAPYR